MDIAANSPGSQNIVHDKKQQGAAHGGHAARASHALIMTVGFAAA
jgi:hypothetical protein